MIFYLITRHFFPHFPILRGNGAENPANKHNALILEGNLSHFLKKAKGKNIDTILENFKVYFNRVCNHLNLIGIETGFYLIPRHFLPHYPIFFYLIPRYFLPHFPRGLRKKPKKIILT